MLATGSGKDFSMRAVAREAGVRLGSLNHYFPTKRDLVDRCLDREYESFTKHIEESATRIDDGTDPIEVLEKFVRRLFRETRANRELARLRILTTVERGDIPINRIQNNLVPALERVAEMFNVPDERRQILHYCAHSLGLLVGRYVTFSDQTHLHISEKETLEEALEAAETHLVHVAVALISLIVD